MVDDWAHEETKRVLIRHLVKETGINEAAARNLVETVGLHWTSLVRDARMIQKQP